MRASLVVVIFSSLLATWAHPLLEERQNGKFDFFELPTALAGPCDLSEGPDGALWGIGILLNEIFRVDPDTGKVEEYRIPTTTPFSNITIPGLSTAAQDRLALACAIRPGADGNMYATNGLRNQLLRINVSTKKIDVIEPTPVNPLGNLFPFNDIYTDDHGMWMTQTTGNVFQYYEYATEKWTTYHVPTPLALPLGCYVGSDGLVYMSEFLANKMLVFDPKTQKTSEYTLPLPEQFPAVIRAERDGWVYFSLFTGDGVGRINMKTHKIDLFPTNQIGGLGSVTTGDSRGGIWLSFFTLDVIARLDTKTLKYDYVPFPGTFAELGANGILGDLPPYVDISVQYGPGDAVWFGSFLRNAVGRYKLS